MKKLRMIASGRVQGVGFRWSVVMLATEIGDIYGRIWNNDDGTVEILAQSTDNAKLMQFISAVRQGPSPMSKVTYLDVNMANFEDFHDFKTAN